MGRGQCQCRQCRRFRHVPGGFSILPNGLRDQVCLVCRRGETESLSPPPRADEPDDELVRCVLCSALVFVGREADHLRDDHGIADPTPEKVAAAFRCVLRGGERLELKKGVG